MVQLCAKPGCSETVELWLDFAPGRRQVIERSTRGDCTVGLCRSHGSRFTVPAGWSYERLEADTDLHGVHEVEQESEPTVAASAAPEGARNRQHRRDRPWFLALSNTLERSPEPAGAVSGSDRRELSDDLSAGSLLHRAFHGPDRETDAIRAEQDHHDELESRRSARSAGGAAETVDDGVAELPFPPNEAEHRAAVS